MQHVVDRRAVSLFLALAFGGAWLVASPLWFSDRGLEYPLAPALLVAMMFTPSLAVLLTEVALRRRPAGATWRADLLHRTGIRREGGFNAWRPWGLLAWLAPLPMVLMATAISAATGALHLDLQNFSGYRAVLADAGAGTLPIPIWVLVVAQIPQVLVAGWINVIPALGEEWGWRGWLLTELRGLGRWPSVVAVGVIWGLWHAPVILLGYNFPGHAPAVSLLLMVAFCIAAGAWLGWMRLASNSVWPAAIGHGFINAAAGLPVLVSASGWPIDNAQVGLLGWPGWLVLAVVTTATIRRPRSR